jgi:hypothetical protein
MDCPALLKMDLTRTGCNAAKKGFEMTKDSHRLLPLYCLG